MDVCTFHGSQAKSFLSFFLFLVLHISIWLMLEANMSLVGEYVSCRNVALSS